MTDLSALSDDELKAMHANTSAPGDLSKLSDAELTALHTGAAPEKLSAAADFGKAVPTGLAKAVIGAPGIPGSFQDMGNQLVDKIMLGAIHKGQDWTGYGPQAGTPERGRFDKLWSDVGNNSHLPTSGDIVKAAEDAGTQFHKPQGMAGRAGETLGEALPNAVLGGEGWLAKTANVVLPAAGSEVGGELAKDTKYEGLMRVLGGLFGNGVSGAAASRASAPERMVRHATEGVTPAEYDAASGLQRRAADMNIPLSGPEAIQSTTGGATRLGDIQRIVEGSAGGGTQTARFYSERPGQVADATARTLDTIAPASPAPSTLGPRAAEAATNELDHVRRNINTATRPAYQQAENHTLTTADFDPIARDPAFQASLRRLREDEVLGPMYEHQPDNSVAVIDAVTKDMRDRGVALGNAANPGFSSQTASRYTTGSHEARDIARDPARGGVQAYDDALVAQEQSRRQNLEPLEQGPLGRVAAAKDTTGAANAVLPSKPLTGGHNELVDAITRIEQQAPGVGSSLVRQRLADQADSSTGRLVGGENQYGGAKFAKDIAGTPQAERNLHDVTESLRVGPWQPGGPPPSDLQDLVEVLRATGARKPQGSATAFNQQLNHELEKPPVTAEIAAALKSGGLTVPTGVRDSAKRAWLGRGTGQLAEMFLAPDSVERIRGISQRAAQTPMTDAMLRQALETLGELSRGK